MAGSADSNTRFLFKGEVVPTGMGQRTQLEHPKMFFFRKTMKDREKGKHSNIR